MVWKLGPWSCRSKPSRMGPNIKPARLTSKNRRELPSTFLQYFQCARAHPSNHVADEKTWWEKRKKQPWHKSELLRHVDEEQDTQADVVEVRATSCVHHCKVDHCVVRCRISTEARTSSKPLLMCGGLVPSAGVVRRDEEVWDWTRPTEVLHTRRYLAAGHQLP